jgi:hypothetical protein
MGAVIIRFWHDVQQRLRLLRSLFVVCYATSCVQQCKQHILAEHTKNRRATYIFRTVSTNKDPIASAPPAAKITPQPHLDVVYLTSPQRHPALTISTTTNCASGIWASSSPSVCV